MNAWYAKDNFAKSFDIFSKRSNTNSGFLTLSLMCIKTRSNKIRNYTDVMRLLKFMMFSLFSGPFNWHHSSSTTTLLHAYCLSSCCSVSGCIASISSCVVLWHRINLKKNTFSLSTIGILFLSMATFTYRILCSEQEDIAYSRGSISTITTRNRITVYQFCVQIMKGEENKARQ